MTVNTMSSDRLRQQPVLASASPRTADAGYGDEEQGIGQPHVHHAAPIPSYIASPTAAAAVGHGRSGGHASHVLANATTLGHQQLELTESGPASSPVAYLPPDRRMQQLAGLPSLPFPLSSDSPSSSPLRTSLNRNHVGHSTLQVSPSSAAFGATRTANLQSPLRASGPAGAPARNQQAQGFRIVNDAATAGVNLEIRVQHSRTMDVVTTSDLKPLQPGSRLFYYGKYANETKVADGKKGLPDVLTKHPTSYLLSDIKDSLAGGSRELITGVLGRGGASTPDSTVYVQLYVLFPSLMRPPMWLRRDFSQVKTARVQVDWDLSARDELFLRVMYRADKARKQALHVWRCKRLHGPGQRFTLFGPEGTAELTDRPYILAMQFYERATDRNTSLLPAFTSMVTTLTSSAKHAHCPAAARAAGAARRLVQAYACRPCWR